jgi:uncharacterized GH25 family protein
MKRSLIVLISLFITGMTQAHEFWVMPSSFSPAPLQQTGFALYVGAGWPGESVPRDPSRLVRFELIDAQGSSPLEAEPAADPAGIAAPKALGTAIAVYRSNQAEITLEAAKFEAYLLEEGLEQISKARAARGQSQQPGRELYSRCAKALVRVGGARGSSAGFDRNVGLTLELIPENDPFALIGGGTLRLRLLYNDKPLAGVLIKAASRAQPKRWISGRSDAQGRVALKLPEAGVWLINAVQMIEAPTGSRADWESVWSSLTLELPSR